ncbi:MAG: DUF3465 domain-containing protein [Planctomycetota bacterium]|jgi:hypothetical protein
MSDAQTTAGSGGKKGLLGTLGTLLLVGVAFIANQLGLLPTSEAVEPAAGGPSGGGTAATDQPTGQDPVDLSDLQIGTRFESSTPTLELTSLDRLRQAVEGREERVWMTLEGEVVKVLADDLEGSRHQRFLFDVAPGIPTLKLSHNIDLAPRIPLTEGDTFVTRGRYEWNEFGGVIHWTHHDPDGDIEGGWVEFEGERYE